MPLIFEGETHVMRELEGRELDGQVSKAVHGRYGNPAYNHGLPCPHMPPALLLLLHAALVSARLFHSLPHDTLAFPKFRVSFLDARPVSDDTARLWLSHGLRGGQPEF